MLPELRIFVDKIGEKQYKSRLTDMTNGQVVGTNTFTYDPELLVHSEPQTYLEKGVPRHEFEAVRAGLHPPAGSETCGRVSDPIAAFGQRLFSYLVGNRAAWEGFLRFSPAFQGQARLNIALDPQAAVLWSVPWEYLHDGSSFLALQGRWQIGRLPWALPEVTPGPAPLPLRVLVVIASPKDQAELNVEREIELIQEALDEAQGRGVVKVDFLEFATLDDLREALTGQSYQVLHFTGHGSWNAAEQRNSLAFEDDEGQTDHVTPDELCPLVVGKGLLLAVLSSCLGARTGSRDAFIGMGTALLRAGVPVVLAMQSSILDESGIALGRAFYTALGRGLSVEEALQQVRLALWQRPGGPGSDWGLPALYLRTHELRLIDPQARVEAKPELRLNVGGLPLPRGFVGRKEELRAIRRAVLGQGGPEGCPYVYVWGLGGVGKTALAAKALAKLDPHLAGWAVVDCRRERMPLADVLSTLANFLRGRSLRETQLAEVLLDSRRSLADRVSILAQNTPHDRFLFVFDNLETQMRRESGNREIRESGDRQPGGLATLPLSDPEWQEFFSAVFRQNWHCTWLFTSRYRLDLLDEVPQSNRLELHLPGLNRRQAIMFMNNLPRLSQEPLADKLAAFDRIGGHPKTIELLEGWLAPSPPSPLQGGEGRRLRTLLDDPATATRLAEQWEGYFLGELLGRLTADERRALEAVSVFQGPFWWQMVEWMLPSPVARATGEGPGVRALSRFHDLSLVQLEGIDKDGDAWYTLHPVVREYLWGRLSAAEQERLHLRAAAWYREQILGPYREQLKGHLTPENESEVAAAVLYQLASQTQDMARARWAVATGLLWRGHLFAARRWEEAGDIVTHLWMVLNRWGQRDLAKSLLRESIAQQEGYGKAVAQGNVASLLMDEGRLDEVLATYEEVYHTFEELGKKRDMAVALGQISSVYMDKGDYARAIERQQASLNIQQEIGDEEGQASSLHQLSGLYLYYKEDYVQALATSRQAEGLNRKLGLESGIAANLHAQGLILNRMDKPAEAFARFQESLGISRRIGNEAGAADNLGEIGKLLRNTGRMAETIAAFTECLDVHRRLNNPAKMGIDLENLGSVHELQGEYAAALEKYEQARQLYVQYWPPGLQYSIEQRIARVRTKMAGGS